MQINQHHPRAQNYPGNRAWWPSASAAHACPSVTHQSVATDLFLPGVAYGDRLTPSAVGPSNCGCHLLKTRMQHVVQLLCLAGPHQLCSRSKANILISKQPHAKAASGKGPRLTCGGALSLRQGADPAPSCCCRHAAGVPRSPEARFQSKAFESKALHRGPKDHINRRI